MQNSMRVKEIMDLAKLHIDDGITLSYARRWINDAKEEIATITKTGRILDFLKIEAKKGKWINLPSNLINIYQVEKDEREYNDYQINHNRIRFNNDGVFNIEYLRSAKNVMLESDVLEIHPSYRPCVALYLAGREKQRFNPDDPDGVRLIAEFYQRIQLVDISLSRPKRKRIMKATPYM